MRIGLPIVVFLSASALAQPASVPAAGTTIEVSIVNVDVFVTDKEGNRVRGLTRGDFEIRENGRAQPVANFAEYRGSAAGALKAGDAAAPETAAETAPGRRTVIVFIERFALPPARTKEVFDSIRALLRNTIRKGDAAAVVSWARQLEVRQPLTDDVARLEQAVTAIQTDSRPLRHGDQHFAKRQQFLEVQFHENFRRAEEEKAGNSRAGTDVPPRQSHGKDFSDQDTFRSAKMEWFWIRQKAAAVTSLIESIAGAEGRKAVIMATDRFGLYAGLDLFQGSVPNRYQRELDTRPIRDALVATANAHNVTLYPVYPAAGHEWGLLTDVTDLTMNYDTETVNRERDASRLTLTNDIAVNETKALGEIAEKTGGQTAWSVKDIVSLVPRIADDLESYYSLGYRATPRRGKEQDARQIVVRVKNPEYRVRSRREYVDRTDAARMKDRVVANLFTPLDAKQLPITAAIDGSTNMTGGRRAIRVAVRVPIGKLTTLQEGSGAAGRFSVFVAAGGEFGVTSEPQQHSQPFTIPAADLARARASHFTYEVQLEVDALSDRVSVGVLDEVSRDCGLTLLELPPRGTEGETTRSR